METEISQRIGKYCLSEDERCDTLGHNAKCLTYTAEAGSSNCMEFFSFEKVINEVRKSNIKVGQMTTDRHIQIKKYMREKDINHHLMFHVQNIHNFKENNILKKLYSISFTLVKHHINIVLFWKCFSSFIQNTLWNNLLVSLP